MHYLWRKLVSSVLVLAVALGVSTSRAENFSTTHTQPLWSQWRICGRLRVIAQDDALDENEVSSEDIEKYVSVYKAMQRDRSLNIDQAAAAQGLTTRQFRQLENRVQRDEAALQQARDELQAAAKASPVPLGTPASIHR